MLSKKNITKQELAKLKVSVQERELTVEQFIEFVSYDEVMKYNYEAVEEIFIGEAIKSPKLNQCLLIPGNEASLVECDGKIFYKSESNTTYYFLSIIDIFALFFNGTHGEMITNMLSRFNINTDEEMWKTEQRDRYNFNLRQLERLDEWVDNYPNLNKMIMRQSELLVNLNREGRKHVLGIEHQANGISIFFSSIRYLSSLTGNHKDTTTRTISVMALLKLINKVETEMIPEDMWYNTKKNKKIAYAEITYFTIEKMTKENLERADKIAKHAIEKGIRLHNISYESVKDSIGQIDANRIFGNNIDHIKRIKDAKLKKLILEPVYDLEF